ncbi:hypothetical protein [Calycomorphotria hydatis]|uniref:Uncharacterized protein n=1 Tax=Calycomorphotria hydatis TaxID=2528027 RepID=A0A517T5C0_9PLAN|nr:hypothetical protein [Calycomorphotria hydatis]QDT63541.1 hypothetical protein V22_07640 [Calycomorphotria hydatis]
MQLYFFDLFVSNVDVTDESFIDRIFEETGGDGSPGRTNGRDVIGFATSADSLDAAIRFAIHAVTAAAPDLNINHVEIAHETVTELIKSPVT